jgi:hypothetical protein
MPETHNGFQGLALILLKILGHPFPRRLKKRHDVSQPSRLL